MFDDQECGSYVNHLISEHRRLHTVLRQMRAAITQSLGSAEQPSFAEVTQILDRLRQELEHHFAQEEGGGCLDEAVSRCPRLAGEAKRIEAEHPMLLADVSRLSEEAKTLPPSPENQTVIQDEFDKLCQRLRTHEKAENVLLAQGFGMTVNGEENSLQS